MPCLSDTGVVGMVWLRFVHRVERLSSKNQASKPLHGGVNLLLRTCVIIRLLKELICKIIQALAR